MQQHKGVLISNALEKANEALVKYIKEPLRIAIKVIMNSFGDPLKKT